MSTTQNGTLKKVISVLDFLNHIFEYIGVFFLTAMTLIVFVAIVSRAFVGISLSWVEEIATFVMAWIGAIGAGLMSRRGGMTAIEIGIMWMPSTIKKGIKILACLISFILFFIVMIFGFKMAMVVKPQMATTVPHMSMMYVYLAMPAGFLMMFVNTLAHMIEIVTEEEKK